MDSIKCQCLSNSFPAVAEDISKELFSSHATSSDGHWTKWSDFCGAKDLDPLIVSRKYPVTILNDFSQQYRNGVISPSVCPLRTWTVSCYICHAVIQHQEE